jgi:hypothetical protein
MGALLSLILMYEDSFIKFKQHNWGITDNINISFLILSSLTSVTVNDRRSQISEFTVVAASDGGIAEDYYTESEEEGANRDAGQWRVTSLPRYFLRGRATILDAGERESQCQTWCVEGKSWVTELEKHLMDVKIR